MKIRRPFRVLGYLTVFVAAAGYVVFSAWRLPAYNGSFAGDLIAMLRTIPQPTRLVLPSYYAWPTESRWVARGKEGFLLPTEDPLARIAVMVLIDESEPRLGLWHPVLETQNDWVELRYCIDGRLLVDSTYKVNVLNAVRSVAANRFPTDRLDYYIAGGGSTSRILWLGVLGDLSILAAFAAIVFSLVKLRREIRWRKPGCCTECDYDLAGLTTDKCPECGAAVMSATRNEGA